MKKKIKTILAVVVIAIIVVSALLFFVVFQEQDKSSKFIGMWRGSKGDSSVLTELIWTFYSNGTVNLSAYSTSYDPDPWIVYDLNTTHNTLTINNVGHYSNRTEWTTWEVNNNKLYLNIDYQSFFWSGSFVFNPGMDYEFSNADTQVTLNYDYLPRTFTKIKESDFKDINVVKWEDVNISVYKPEIVNWNWINLTRSPISYYGDHAPSEWGYITKGDVLQIGEYESAPFVGFQLIWVPTGEVMYTFTT